MKISDYVSIGENSVIEAASIGNMVQIGKNCVIVRSKQDLLVMAYVLITSRLEQGRFTIIKDCAIIQDDTVLAPGTVVPSMTVFGGSPGVLMGDIPESYPEILEAAALNYYAEFKHE
jgi:dynactin-5